MRMNDGTTQRVPLSSGSGAEAARWRCRQAAYRIAADCERLLDELLDANVPAVRDALSRSLAAARHLATITGARDHGGPALFDDAGRPSTRLADAKRRLSEALMVDRPPIILSPTEEMAFAAVAEMREAVATLFTADRSPPNGSRLDSNEPAQARVLIVDDEPLMITLLQRAVRSMGHETVSAPSAEDGQRVMASTPVDLVLTDIEMPGMSGIQFLEALKKNEATRRIPVIVISSADDMDSVTRCIVLGAEDHIPKPFQHDLLRARVRASLERKRLMDADTAHRVAVTKLIDAAEAVESETYSPELIGDVTGREDGVGRLARVFDRMVMNLRTREHRLRERVRHLRREVASSGKVFRPDPMPEESSFAVGDVVSDRYVITGTLGQGGMGTVYSARDAELGEEIALKSVRADLLRLDATLATRLKSEILLTRKISHPNVVRSHEFGQWSGHYFITMELVHGITLADLLDQRGRLTAASTLAIATQLCDALAVAHEANVIHRDIKPANLVVDDSGALKVMDFGIARSLMSTEDVTGRGIVIGTPRYMAPELLIGQPPSTRTDIYAVGVVLYECLTGQIPFWADTPADLVREIYGSSFEPLDRVIPAISPALARLIHQQLSYDPQRRAGSARELEHRLSQIDLATDPGRPSVP
jgi:CheY-like chemotaxis protein